MGMIQAFRDLIRGLKDARQDAADVMRLDAEIRRRKIAAAEDLDHAYLSKLIKSMDTSTEVRIILRSGETIQIVKPDMKPIAEEGPGW